MDVANYTDVLFLSPHYDAIHEIMKKTVAIYCTMLFSSFDTQMMEIIPRVGLSHIFYANVAISRHISRHPANCNVSRHPAHATISSHHDNACVFSHQ